MITQRQVHTALGARQQYVGKELCLTDGRAAPLRLALRTLTRCYGDGTSADGTHTDRNVCEESAQDGSATTAAQVAEPRPELASARELECGMVREGIYSAALLDVTEAGAVESVISHVHAHPDEVGARTGEVGSVKKALTPGFCSPPK